MIVGAVIGAVVTDGDIEMDGDIVGVSVGCIDGIFVVLIIGDEVATGTLGAGRTGPTTGEVVVVGEVIGASTTGAAVGEVAIGGAIGKGELGVVVDELGF